MKINFLPDVEREHWIKSLFYLVGSIALIAISFVAGLLKDSTPGVLMFTLGSIVFFYAVPHPWGNAKYYVIEFAVLFGAFTLLWIFGSRSDYWNEIKKQGDTAEAVGWFLLGVCIQAFIGIMTGIFVFSEGPRCRLYHATSVALLALFIMFPQSLFPSSSLKPYLLITMWIFSFLQFTLIAALFWLASRKETTGRLSIMTMLIAVVMLIPMALWGFFINNDTHWMVGIRLWAMLEIVCALLVVSVLLLPFLTKEN
jgi:hypothetical protein